MSKKTKNVYANMKNALAGPAAGETIGDTTGGACYLAVRLSSGLMGLAHQEGHDPPGGTAEARIAEGFRGKSAGSALPFIGDEDPLLASVGGAVACALAQKSLTSWEAGDIMEHIRIEENERVVMIGGFPIAASIRDAGAELSVFDRAWGIGSHSTLSPALEGADVVIITGTTINNGTFPEIMAGIKKAREVVLLGPSTPLIPEAFRHTPVTRLFGVVIPDANAVRKVVESGGGMRQISPLVEKVCVPVERE
jgi:uncharacterized protein (DUF4213/DUF364 family)